MSDEPVRIAVIGGSGLYHMAQLTDISEQRINTPFGDPSDAIITGTLKGARVAFLPRHGRGHVHTPSTVPYQANIYALKSIGVERIISVSACGSLREDYAPGHVVIPDQLYDNTRGARGNTFFGDGLVAHISVADPFCNDLSSALASATKTAGGEVHIGGAFITVEGPRFSTKAESNVFRSWGMSLVGMTTSPEAFLAREAGICYAVMAHVTDYDVWHESEEPVTVEMVIKTLNSNLALAQEALTRLIPEIATQPRVCACQRALATAVITDGSKIPAETKKRIAPIIKGFVS